MASSAEFQSTEKLAQRLLKFLQHHEHEKCSTLVELMNATKKNDEVWEELRIQSDQFASIYPLFEGAEHRVYRFFGLLIFFGSPLIFFFLSDPTQIGRFTALAPK